MMPYKPYVSRSTLFRSALEWNWGGGDINVSIADRMKAWKIAEELTQVESKTVAPKCGRKGCHRPLFGSQRADGR